MAQILFCEGKISNRMNTLNIPTHYAKDDRKLRKHGKRAPEKTTGLWRAGRVRNMLKNTAYMGTWVYGKRSKKPKKELIECFYPAIVSDELFKRAQQTLERNRWIPKNKETRKYLIKRFPYTLPTLPLTSSQASGFFF